MLNKRYFIMVILFLSFFSLQRTTSHAQDILSDRWWDMPEIYVEYELLETSMVFQTPDGYLYRISRTTPLDEYSVHMIDASSLDIVQAYWGQRYVETFTGKIGEMWSDLKMYVIEILEKIREMMGLVGVIVLFVCSGVLTYFINSTFPVFPPKWVFYVMFALLCAGWVYVTSIWSSVIYACGVLVLPYVVIGLLGMGYRKVQQRFGKEKHS